MISVFIPTLNVVCLMENIENTVAFKFNHNLVASAATFVTDNLSDVLKKWE